MGTQTLAQQAEKSAPHGGVVYRMPDIAVGGGSRMRDAETLAAFSRCTTSRWWERTDPYWNDSLFDSHRPWSDMARSNAVFPRSGKSIGYTNALEEGETGNRSQLRLPEDEDDLLAVRRAVSVLFGAGCATTEQLQAFCGVSRRFVQDDLLATGLVEYSWHHFPSAAYPRVQVWRLRLRSSEWSAYAAACAAEGHAATMFLGCHPLHPAVGSSRAHIRHQTLALEIVLRAMELDDTWVGWLPEGACSPSRFCPDTHPGRDRGGSMRADACLLRVDGARVFVEIQASSNQASVQDKVLRWSRLLDEGGFSGLVLFVAADRNPHTSAGPALLRATIEEHASLSAAERMLVGWWPDYSPDICQLTAAAGSLRAASRTADGGWSETHANKAEVTQANGDWWLLSQVEQFPVTPPWAGTLIHAGGGDV